MIVAQLFPQQAATSVEGVAVGLIGQMEAGHASVDGFAAGVVLMSEEPLAPSVEGFAMGIIFQT